MRAGAHLRVNCSLRPRPHQAFHLEDVLGTDALGLGKDLGTIRVENHLQQAFAIPEIDKDHAAMVAATVYPAAHLDFLANQGLADLSTIVTAHR